MNFSEGTGLILNEINNTVARVNPAEAERFYDAVTSAGRVFVTGEGRSLFIAQTFAMRLTHLGIVAAVIGEATCPKPGAGDLLVAISGSALVTSLTASALDPSL